MPSYDGLGMGTLAFNSLSGIGQGGAGVSGPLLDMKKPPRTMGCEGLMLVGKAWCGTIYYSDRICQIIRIEYASRPGGASGRPR